ncbi:MAG: DUF4846 domain-containing protein [Leptospirales bacterium]|jgi:hypothetical protein
MSFLQKRQAVLAGTAYKAAITAAFLLYAARGDPNFAQGSDTGIVPSRDYRWPGLSYESEHSIGRRIPPPSGAVRTRLDPDGFGAWLRGLPLKPGRPAVYLHDGRLKANQAAHHAVIDIDTGTRNLQQCADALLRLRSEYFFARDEFARIRFRFTDQSESRYTMWARGYRPSIRERRKTRWALRAQADSGYAGFRSYLQNLFTYAGTYSLDRESQAVPIADMRVGDFLIQGGFPGHAVIVVDMAETRRPDAAGNRRRYYLLAQSYMPAQDLHVLRNPAGRSPWYALDVAGDPGSSGADDAGHPATRRAATAFKISTPEWEFSAADLKRFQN